MASEASLAKPEWGWPLARSRRNTPNENPRHRWRGFPWFGECGDQPADEDDGAIAGASTDDEAGAIVSVLTADEAEASADEAAEDTACSAEDAAEETACSAEETAELAASDDTTALDAAVVVVVELPRLKTQMRPMMMITATMMMIQVLRFMNEPFLLVEVVWEE